MSDNPYRLPASARPSRYRIELSPDLDKARFTGSVDISIDVSVPIDALVLNSVDLEIESATLDGNRPLRIDLDPDSERVTFTPDQPLQAGRVELHVEFRGVLNDKLLGFYRSTFDHKDEVTGKVSKRDLAVTQFESTHARRAFPCFDEPEMKATFETALVIDRDLFAVSNGAEVSRSELADGRVRVQFAETMVMSTYLVAFVVGPLVATEPRMVAGIDRKIPLRVVYPPGSGHLCEFALDVAEAALKFYESYYGIAYPGDKVDLVAVPDFAFGAMENLGCITFREVLLLVDPSEATQPELQRVADVINHELAHMWFGDLVTMKWWNGIWLNEAFATFMEITASDAFRPDWDVWTNFGLARTVAFDTDALHSTRPIEFRVESPADAEAMFDILTYEKGASVVRMLEQYLGAETFRSGISAYLKKHAYSTTETTDLWDALEAVSGEPVRQMMDSWIFQGGHPIVTVTPTDRGVRLSQKRFSFDTGGTLGNSPGGGGGATETSGGGNSRGATGTVAAESEQARWLIPIKLRARLDGSADQVQLSHVLDDEVEIDLGGRPNLVQINGGANGFFRSALSPELRASLARDTSANALERFMLIDDTLAALHAGAVDYDEVWALLVAMAQSEMDPAVWRRISAAAKTLDRLGGPERAPLVRQMVIEMTTRPMHDVRQVLDEASADDAAVDSHRGPGRVPSAESTSGSSRDFTKLEEVRGVITALRGGLGADAQTRATAREVFRNDGQDASLMAAAIEIVAGSATPEEHSELERRWRDGSTPQESLRYLTSLVDTDDSELFERALGLTLVDVRTQNAPYLLRRALTNSTLGHLGWSFIHANWDSIAKRFPANSLPRMIEGIRSVTDRKLAESIQTFLGSVNFVSGSQQIDQHLEGMWVSVAVAERARKPKG
ncbi:MAG: M1 family aminopeptidase [Microthrixaceae bacterium]